MFVECPNCRTRVSTRAVTCPECHGPLRAPPRDLAAPVFRWSFIVFNVVMICWTLFYAATGRTTLRPPEIVVDAGEDALAVTGTPIAGGMGVGFLLVLWGLGFVILGLCAAFARVKSADRRRTSLIR